MNQYFVYILTNKANKVPYIGVTVNDFNPEWKDLSVENNEMLK